MFWKTGGGCRPDGAEISLAMAWLQICRAAGAMKPGPGENPRNGQLENLS